MAPRNFSFMDVVNQWMITFALFAICALLFWQLLPTLADVKKKIEAESKLNEQRAAEQRKSSNATLEAIREKIGNEELWRQVKPRLENISKP